MQDRETAPEIATGGGTITPVTPDDLEDKNFNDWLTSAERRERAFKLRANELETIKIARQAENGVAIACGKSVLSGFFTWLISWRRATIIAGQIICLCQLVLSGFPHFLSGFFTTLTIFLVIPALIGLSVAHVHHLWYQ
jgi:hypothetical protein